MRTGRVFQFGFYHQILAFPSLHFKHFCVSFLRKLGHVTVLEMIATGYAFPEICHAIHVTPRQTHI